MAAKGETLNPTRQTYSDLINACLCWEGCSCEDNHDQMDLRLAYYYAMEMRNHPINWEAKLLEHKHNPWLD